MREFRGGGSFASPLLLLRLPSPMTLIARSRQISPWSMSEEAGRRTVRLRPCHLSGSDTLCVVIDVFNLAQENNNSFLSW